MEQRETTEPQGGLRPRVEGDREQEIFDATLNVLAEVGYDRLTMDSVATAARASKATLYRRWSGKSALVIDALSSQKEEGPLPDTGNLRDDLVEAFCSPGGLTDTHQLAVFSSVITAMGRDQEFAEAFRRDFIAPKFQRNVTLFKRAQARGDISPDLDLDLITPALPGIVLHRMFMLGDLPTAQLIMAVIDQIVMPAVAYKSPTGAPTATESPNQKAAL